MEKLSWKDVQKVPSTRGSGGAMHKMLAILAAGGGKAVAKQLAEHDYQGTVVRSLMEKGFIERVSRGVYQITQAGTERLAAMNTVIPFDKEHPDSDYVYSLDTLVNVIRPFQIWAPTRETYLGNKKWYMGRTPQATLITDAYNNRRVVVTQSVWRTQQPALDWLDTLIDDSDSDLDCGNVLAQALPLKLVGYHTMRDTPQQVQSSIDTLSWKDVQKEVLVMVDVSDVDYESTEIGLLPAMEIDKFLKTVKPNQLWSCLTQFGMMPSNSTYLVIGTEAIIERPGRRMQPFDEVDQDLGERDSVTFGNAIETRDLTPYENKGFAPDEDPIEGETLEVHAQMSLFVLLKSPLFVPQVAPKGHRQYAVPKHNPQNFLSGFPLTPRPRRRRGSKVSLAWKSIDQSPTEAEEIAATIHGKFEHMLERLEEQVHLYGRGAGTLASLGMSEVPVGRFTVKLDCDRDSEHVEAQGGRSIDFRLSACIFRVPHFIKPSEIPLPVMANGIFRTDFASVPAEAHIPYPDIDVEVIRYVETLLSLSERDPMKAESVLSWKSVETGPWQNIREEKPEVHQQLMDEFHDAWQTPRNTGLKKDEMLGKMSEQHQAAAVLGWLNYQVDNGGFSQWHYNNYSQFAPLVEKYLRMVDTPTAKEALEIVGTAMQGIENMDDAQKSYVGDGEEDEYAEREAQEQLDKCDTRWYDISDQLLVDINSWLHDFTAAAPKQKSRTRASSMIVQSWKDIDEEPITATISDMFDYDLNDTSDTHDSLDGHLTPRAKDMFMESGMRDFEDVLEEEIKAGRVVLYRDVKLREDSTKGLIYITTKVVGAPNVLRRLVTELEGTGISLILPDDITPQKESNMKSNAGMTIHIDSPEAEDAVLQTILNNILPQDLPEGDSDKGLHPGDTDGEHPLESILESEDATADDVPVSKHKGKNLADDEKKKESSLFSRLKASVNIYPIVLKGSQYQLEDGTLLPQGFRYKFCGQIAHPVTQVLGTMGRLVIAEPVGDQIDPQRSVPKYQRGQTVMYNHKDLTEPATGIIVAVNPHGYGITGPESGRVYFVTDGQVLGVQENAPVLKGRSEKKASGEDNAVFQAIQANLDPAGTHVVKIVDQVGTSLYIEGTPVSMWTYDVKQAATFTLEGALDVQQAIVAAYPDDKDEVLIEEKGTIDPLASMLAEEELGGSHWERRAAANTPKQLFESWFQQNYADIYKKYTAHSIKEKEMPDLRSFGLMLFNQERSGMPAYSLNDIRGDELGTEPPVVKRTSQIDYSARLKRMYERRGEDENGVPNKLDEMQVEAGTWSGPTTVNKAQQLVKYCTLLYGMVPVEEALRKLYAWVGDDDLFDKLEDAAQPDNTGVKKIQARTLRAMVKGKVREYLAAEAAGTWTSPWQDDAKALLQSWVGTVASLYHHASIEGQEKVSSSVGSPEWTNHIIVDAYGRLNASGTAEPTEEDMLREIDTALQNSGEGKDARQVHDAWVEWFTANRAQSRVSAKSDKDAEILEDFDSGYVDKSSADSSAMSHFLEEYYPEEIHRAKALWTKWQRKSQMFGSKHANSLQGESSMTHATVTYELRMPSSNGRVYLQRFASELQSAVRKHNIEVDFVSIAADHSSAVLQVTSTRKERLSPAIKNALSAVENDLARRYMLGRTTEASLVSLADDVSDRVSPMGWTQNQDAPNNPGTAPVQPPQQNLQQAPGQPAMYDSTQDKGKKFNITVDPTDKSVNVKFLNSQEEDALTNALEGGPQYDKNVVPDLAFRQNQQQGGNGTQPAAPAPQQPAAQFGDNPSSTSF